MFQYTFFYDLTVSMEFQENAFVQPVQYEVVNNRLSKNKNSSGEYFFKLIV